ncbi:hypothetical protein K1719_031928 [Acacia pycnantha]|nr:hypothetical protein K1719_031928 [Acacia pycnantha]
MKISLSFLFHIFIIVSIFLLQPQNCWAASPANNTVTATTEACDSHHRCLMVDLAGTDSFNSDPHFLSTLSSKSDPPVTNRPLTPDKPSGKTFVWMSTSEIARNRPHHGGGGGMMKMKSGEYE